MGSNGDSAGLLVGGGLVFLLIVLAIAVFYIACMWKIFAKAGQPGWAAIIPIYNIIVLLQVCQRPLWWIILYIFFAPIIAIILLFDLARVFGRSAGFALGLWFLGVIFFPILAFGDSRYVAQGQMVRVG
ncbi:MAG: Signal peptidase I [Ktedonobacterales bacterium]|jgi:hypothetical protein|nr:MAG: Signal peptidase I [Ktedonobacterales bacterium]